MPERDTGSSPTSGRAASLVSSLLIAALLLGGLWFAARGWPQRNSPAAQTEAPASAQDWPTAPPTFTPLPSPTSLVVVTPTPLPLPSWQEIGQFATIEYYDSVDREVIHDNWAPGKDRASVRVVASVKLGIDLNQAQTASLQPENRSIAVTLPAVKILSVTYIPERSQILDTQQQWVLSRYPGLEKQAMDQGLAEIERRANANEKMFSIATELTKSRIERLLRSYGFTTVEISFQ